MRLQQNFARKTETNQILTKNENMEKIQTTAYMREETEPGVKVKAEMETQKLVSKGHLPHMR